MVPARPPLMSENVDAVIMPSHVPITTQVRPRIDSEWKERCPYCQHVSVIAGCLLDTHLELLRLSQSLHIQLVLVRALLFGNSAILTVASLHGPNIARDCTAHDILFTVLCHDAAAAFANGTKSKS
jgi:hypothetical protein